MADTGWVFPGSGSSGTPSGGTNSWSGAGNITADDGSAATAGLTGSPTLISKVLRASNFTFSIPSGATIDGIEARIEFKDDFGYGDSSSERLIDDAAAFKGSDKSVGTSFTSSYVVRTVGGATDLWGTTWTEAQVSDVDFGFGFQAKNTTFLTCNASVNYVQMKIYYTAAAGSGFTPKMMMF